MPVERNIVRVQEKGQVTLPTDIRKRLGIKKGEVWVNGVKMGELSELAWVMRVERAAYPGDVRLSVGRIDKWNRPTVQERMIQLAKTDG